MFIAWEIQVFIAILILMAMAPLLSLPDLILCLVFIVSAALFGLEQ